MGRILVVDDDQQVRRLLCRALTERGHAVTVASNGDEGLDRFAATVPDVLILDLMMPKRDGFSVLRALGDLLTVTQTKVLVLTGQSSDDHWLRAYELGAHHYLPKPFVIEELNETIDRLLGASYEEADAQRSKGRRTSDLLTRLEDALRTKDAFGAT